MRQIENVVHKRYICKRKYRRRKKRLHRLARHLFPVSAFLFATIVCMVAFMPSGDKTVDPPAADVPASNESIQNSPPQSASDPSVASEPIAAGTWKLVLVNPWNPLPENYTVQTVTLQNGLQVDERCYPDLQAMMDACRADGLTPVICSAYRTQEVQESLYQQEVGRYLDKGYDQDAAEAEAGKSVAVPGTSEHQLGLAVDIVDIDHQLLDESQENTEVQKWLMAHSWEYGFILRYPTGKSEITGIIYEPWHYRYVGRDDAKQIHALGVCLEEYLAD